MGPRSWATLGLQRGGDMEEEPLHMEAGAAGAEEGVLEEPVLPHTQSLATEPRVSLIRSARQRKHVFLSFIVSRKLAFTSFPM